MFIFPTLNPSLVGGWGGGRGLDLSLEVSTLFIFFVYFEPFEERKDYSSARDINKLLANFRYCHSYISAVTTTCWSNLCFSVPPLVIVRSESLS